MARLSINDWHIYTPFFPHNLTTSGHVFSQLWLFPRINPLLFLGEPLPLDVVEKNTWTLRSLSLWSSTIFSRFYAISEPLDWYLNDMTHWHHWERLFHKFRNGGTNRHGFLSGRRNTRWHFQCLLADKESEWCGTARISVISWDVL